MHTNLILKHQLNWYGMMWSVWKLKTLCLLSLKSENHHFGNFPSTISAIVRMMFYIWTKDGEFYVCHLKDVWVLHFDALKRVQTSWKVLIIITDIVIRHSAQSQLNANIFSFTDTMCASKSKRKHFFALVRASNLLHQKSNKMFRLMVQITVYASVPLL